MVPQDIVKRVVFDTNVVVSSLLFEKGRLSWLRRIWQAGEVTPLVSKLTVEELLNVLAYPKFRLEKTEREELLADYLPYAEIVKIPSKLAKLPQCRDPYDQKFIELAITADADILVTGDQDITAMKGLLPIKLMEPEEFRQLYLRS